MTMSVFVIKMRLDDSFYGQTELYYVFAKTATDALTKAYKAFARDTRAYDSGTLTVLSLERVDATVVK
jgi:uridine phosphorylase